MVVGIEFGIWRRKKGMEVVWCGGGNEEWGLLKPEIGAAGWSV